MSYTCQHTNCNRESSVGLAYYIGRYWETSIWVCKDHSHKSYEQWGAPCVSVVQLGKRNLIRRMKIADGKWKSMNDAPEYPKAYKEGGKYCGYSIHPQYALDLKDELDRAKASKEPEKRHIMKSSEPQSSGDLDKIMQVIKTGFTSKNELLKMAETDNILSVVVRINARLKKLGLKLHKKKVKGIQYYGVK